VMLPQATDIAVAEESRAAFCKPLQWIMG
jgi:hypothetical protein